MESLGQDFGQPELLLQVVIVTTPSLWQATMNLKYAYIYINTCKWIIVFEIYVGEETNIVRGGHKWYDYACFHDSLSGNGNGGLYLEFSQSFGPLRTHCPRHLFHLLGLFDSPIWGHNCTMFFPLWKVSESSVVLAEMVTIVFPFFSQLEHNHCFYSLLSWWYAFIHWYNTLKSWYWTKETYEAVKLFGVKLLVHLTWYTLLW